MSDETHQEHHIVVSADTHCGASLRSYRDYLDAKYLDEFDDWARFTEQDNERRKELFKNMERSPLEVVVDGDPEVFAYRNSSSAERLQEQQQDGVIAAVLFPNTQPPFAPPAATSFEAPLAKKHCPTKDFVATPIDYSEIPERAKGCPGMNPLNQAQEVS